MGMLPLYYYRSGLEREATSRHAYLNITSVIWTGTSISVLRIFAIRVVKRGCQGFTNDLFRLNFICYITLSKPMK